MKTPAFLFTMIGCAVLMHGVGYADPSGATVSDHQPGSSLLVGAAHGESVGNNTVNNHTSPVRPPTAVPLTGPSSGNMRKHGPGPAVIGGLANSTRNTAAINGTGMKHRP